MTHTPHSSREIRTWLAMTNLTTEDREVEAGYCIDAVDLPVGGTRSLGGSFFTARYRD